MSNMTNLGPAGTGSTRNRCSPSPRRVQIAYLLWDFLEPRYSGNHQNNQPRATRKSNESSSNARRHAPIISSFTRFPKNANAS
jgi:uncharacterized protein (DUF924 family)